MANNQNLVPFGKNRQPSKSGRKKGIPNRSTAIRKWLECTIIEENEDGTKNKITILDTLIHAQIKKAQLGDTPAFNALMDGAFGKIPQTIQSEVENKSNEPPTIIQIIKNEESIKVIQAAN